VTTEPVRLILVALALAAGASAQAATEGPRMAMQQVDVFTSGAEGYHTFRIPALVVSTKGTLLAFCEGRRKGRGDAGDIDLMLKRSLDGGATWQAMQLVHEEGGGAPITIGNPCPVVDQATGTIHLVLSRNNARAFHTHSADDGATWAAPVEITPVLKGFDFPRSRHGTGPGHGIQLTAGPHKGRLLVPLWLNERIGRNYRSAVLASDDGGRTWRAAGMAGPQLRDANECMAFEAADGSLCLNMRNKVGHRRSVAWSRDGGLTWSEPRHDRTLVGPVCQASILALPAKAPGEPRLVVFANPASTRREKMTVRLSRDEAKTWAAARLVHPGPAAYSDLAALPGGAIGCLYERGDKHPYQKITFARFPLEWLAAPPK